MKQAKSAHDKALAAAQQAHQQQLEETLAANHKAQKEAKRTHEQAVEVGHLEQCAISCFASKKMCTLPAQKVSSV